MSGGSRYPKVSGGVAIGTIIWAVVAGICALAAATVGGIFVLLHAEKLIADGNSVSGAVFLVVGGLLTLPVVCLIGFGIWKLTRQAFIVLGKR
jgi:hypothetical protein